MVKKLGGILSVVLARCLPTSLAALASPRIPVICGNASYAEAVTGELEPVIMAALLARSGSRTGGAA